MQSSTGKSFRPLWIGALLILIAFQNCSPTYSDPPAEDPNQSQLVDAEPTPEPTPVPPPANFRRGDAFSRAALGPIYSFELRAILDAANYENAGGAKAIAIAINGTGFARIAPTGTQDDADRGSIEACNAISGQSCSLVVSGHFFAVDSDKIWSQAQMLLKSGSSGLSASDVPFVLDGERSWVPAYLALTSSTSPFKALALAVSGEYRWAMGRSQSEANRRALQSCEFDAKLPPCLIFAEGNQRVFDLSHWDRAQALRLWPAKFDPDELPFIFEADRSQLTGIFSEIEQGFVAAIAIGRSGTFAGNKDIFKEDAEAKALARCKNIDATCFLYSSSKNVALRWDQLPSKDVPRAVACAIPRASCEAHKERGCGAAPRWLIENGLRVRKQCN